MGISDKYHLSQDAKKNGFIWMCVECGFERRANENVIDHVESNILQLNIRPPYTCTLCTLHFSSRNSFRTHKSRYHGKFLKI